MQKDYLTRQPYLDLLKSIIANQKDNKTGYSFAINGDWGSGKTWILQELENQLLENKDNKYLIFHYNAWENDFYDEPLVALLSVMIESLNTHKKNIKEKGAVGKVITSSITTLTKVAGNVIEKKYSINPNDIIDSLKDSGKAITDVKLTKSDFNKMLPLENALKQIKDVIQKLSLENHIILIVDELDRCLPEYAIKVLERLHHVCYEMPVIQILAINKNNLADSISKVFGKDFIKVDNREAWNHLFADTYLQKFVDMIIPLPNGTVCKHVEVLNGLEKDYEPYIRSNTNGQDFICLDDNFLLEFVSTLMDGIERRLQEKIFKLVALCHKLVLCSNINYKKEQMSYAILIYEIISCICRYVFNLSETCKLSIGQEYYQLCFYQEIVTPNNPNQVINNQLNVRLKSFFIFPIRYSDFSMKKRYAFEIEDTKSYIMAFFHKQDAKFFDSLQNELWKWIAESKSFLQKYDEIMNMLTTK